MTKIPPQIHLPELIALDAVFCGGAQFGSEDANEGCFCGDAGSFVIKKNDIYPTLPHNEWFCSSLAVQCGVPQVPFSVIKHTDGNFWFGSRWMNGKTKDWWTLAEQGSIDFNSLTTDLSRIYAFDLFINNVDRHLNNFMVIQEGNGHRVYSFDYSRAWLYNGFPISPEMVTAESATVKVKDWLKHHFGQYIDLTATTEVLDQIDGINAGTIERILSAHPKDWLTQDQEDGIIRWWNDGSASARVTAIRTGLSNGTLV